MILVLQKALPECKFGAKTHTVFPTLKPDALIYFYFGNLGIISEQVLISDSMHYYYGFIFYHFRNSGIIIVKVLL